MYSSRTIFEEGLLKDAENEMKENVLKDFKVFRSEIWEEYDKKIRTIRNDVVHLNPSGITNLKGNIKSRGTTYGNIVKYNYKTKMIELQSIRNYDGKNLNIIEKMEELRSLIIKMVDKTIHYIFLNHFDSSELLSSNIRINANGMYLVLEDFLIFTKG